jgi:hypothetical protein
LVLSAPQPIGPINQAPPLIDLQKGIGRRAAAVMSDTSLGYGWWQATDGKWYPPETHPDASPRAVATLAPPQWQQGPPTRIKRKKWPWVLGTLFVIFILFIVLIVASIGKALNDLNAEQAAHAISTSQFNAVPLGITNAALVTELGKQPENSQEFVSQGILNSGQINSSCVYYNQTGHLFGQYYQFCFNGDSLNSKNSY